MSPIFKRFGRLLGLGLLLPGLLMSYHGCSRSGASLSTWITGDTAEGTVTDIRTYAGTARPAGSPHRQASVITFTTAEGEVVTFEHPVQSVPPPFGMGERVRVHYDPKAPQHAVAPAGLAMLVLGWGFVATAGMLLVLAAAAILLVAILPWRRRD